MRRGATTRSLHRGRPSADVELLDLFESDPELLALADAVQLAGGAVRPRRRRSAVLAIAVALVLIAAPVSLALGDGLFGFFVGAPATQPVREQYVAFDGSLTGADASRLRIAPVTVRTVRGIAEIETQDGPVYLWSSPEVGGGACYLLQIAHAQASADDGLTMGGCNTREAPVGNMTVDVYVPQRDTTLHVVYGYTYGGATTVRVDFAGKPSLVIPVAERYFLGTIDAHAHVRDVIAYNARGDQVGEVIPGDNAPT